MGVISLAYRTAAHHRSGAARTAGLSFLLQSRMLEARLTRQDEVKARWTVMAGQGSVYRRCGCVDPVTGRQWGNRCPRLAGGRHGSWYVGLELPTGPAGMRQRIRRGGYPSRAAAAAVLAALRSPRPGDPGSRILTVGE
jgi:hypothetical protein